jgi:hypothetical protein
MAKEEGQSASCADQGLDIFDLTFDRIGGSVAAVATAAPDEWPKRKADPPPALIRASISST